MALFREVVVRLEGLCTEKPVRTAVELVGAGLGYHIQRGALGATICRGEAIRADDELLHSLER